MKRSGSQDSGYTLALPYSPAVSWPRRWSFQAVLASVTSWAQAIYSSRWLLGLLLLLGLALRLAGLGNDALWYDEVFTGRLANLDLLSLVRATRWDVHPPLWYLIEWLAVRLIGNEPTGLRLPAALFGTWSSFLMYSLV
jgi:predicted membrane-bound mannosyltransferase